MQTKSGTFTGSGSTGNQAVTGVGFQPEFLIVISDFAANTTPFNDGRVCIGMASSAADQQVIDFRDDGAIGTSNSARSQQSGKIISGLNTTTDAIAVEAALVSFDSDGFTINWTIAGAQLYEYIAIAGADFAAHVGSFDMNGSTGNQTVSGVPFQPKAVMFFGTIDNTTEGAQSQGKMSIGCATASNERWSMSVYDQDNAGVSIAKNYFTESSCIVRADASSVTLAADFVAFTADGFTVNITTALACRMAFVCFGGSAAFHAGTVTQPTSPSTVAETGTGFEPSAVLLASSGTATLDAVSVNSHVTFGWSDENLGVAVAAMEVADAQNTMDSRSAQNSINCIAHIDAAGNSAFSIADMDSLDSDGFTLDWTTANAFAMLVGYLAMGAAPNPGVGGGGRGWMWAG